MESCDSRHFGPISRDRILGMVAESENALRPGFSGVVLSQTGKGLVAKYSTRHLERRRPREPQAGPNSKI
jgi:hypothetical protein